MNEVLFQYHKIEPTTWIYLASLLTIVVYFKFSRLWSVRNLDLVFLILLAPGVVLVTYGQVRHRAGIEQLGYAWLFGMSFVFTIRLLIDPLMVRRPLLEPNLTVGGMTCLGTALLVFLMANVVSSKPPYANLPQGPGFPMLYKLPAITTQVLFSGDDVEEQPQPESRYNELVSATARTIAVLSHVAIVVGMIVVGGRHFGNVRTGIAAAMLYLLIPYTAQMTGHVDHFLPAAFLVWAIAFYRRPLVSGALIGLAASTTYYPLFLLPLWAGFYWLRGLWRFLLGVVCALATLLIALKFTANDFHAELLQMWNLAPPVTSGFWSAHFVDEVYRWPVLALFTCVACALSIWPPQKNLATLMSCSGAVMVAAQFCHTQQGGLYLGWYLPLLLLTIFRPNLEDRVAQNVLSEGWRKRRPTVASAETPTSAN
jgi:hypothetical protein